MEMGPMKPMEKWKVCLGHFYTLHAPIPSTWQMKNKKSEGGKSNTETLGFMEAFLFFGFFFLFFKDVKKQGIYFKRSESFILDNSAT